MIGETDFTSGPSTLHEKAIYIVEGQLFQVERFDFDNRKAFVREVECDYYTDAITYTKVTILDTFAAGAGPQVDGPAASRQDRDDWRAGFGIGDRHEPSSVRTCAGPEASSPSACAGACSHGEVHVVSRVVGFKKIKFYTNENVGSGELDLPEQQMHTTSYWLTIPRRVMAALPFGTADRRDGVLGLAYAMRNVAPLLLMCDGHDLGLSIDGLAVEGASRMGGIARGARRPSSSADADDLHLRQLSGRHRLQRAAVRHARRSSRADARADRRLPVRVRMPVLRRARRRDRAAREGCRVAPARRC